MAKDNSCLNKSSFELKTNTHLRLQREATAAARPNPTNAPVKEVVASVPLVTTRSYASERTPLREKVLTNQNLLEKPECEFSELSSTVEGERKSQQTYICRNKDCDFHHPKAAAPHAGDLPESEIEKLENYFELKVANRVRQEILKKAIEWFDDRRTFWAFDDLIKKLIVEFLYALGDADSEILQIVGDWENAPKNLSDKEKLREFVGNLDKQPQSQILYLLSTSGAEDLEILKIAQDYTKINFLRLDAEMRLELAPDQFKSVAAKYLEAVKNEIPAAVPSFWGNYDDVEIISGEEN